MLKLARIVSIEIIIGVFLVASLSSWAQGPNRVVLTDPILAKVMSEGRCLFAYNGQCLIAGNKMTIE